MRSLGENQIQRRPLLPTTIVVRFRRIWIVVYSVKQERLIHGEPGERSAVSVEEATKREMERWLTLEAQEPEDEADEPDDPE